MKYTIQPTNKGVSVCIEPAPQMVRFDGQMMPIEEVVSMLLCSGMTQDQIFRWLERRMEIGRFAKEATSAQYLQ